jgi:hypothetical protein
MRVGGATLTGSFLKKLIDELFQQDQNQPNEKIDERLAYYRELDRSSFFVDRFRLSIPYCDYIIAQYLIVYLCTFTLVNCMFLWCHIAIVRMEWDNVEERKNKKQCSTNKDQ